MSVLKVNTLGCHPMLLLKKMEAAGGITILKEEKRTFSGVDYPYRIIAQVAEGMYLEAHDFIHEAAVTEGDLPHFAPLLSGDVYPYPYAHTQLEATESDKVPPVLGDENPSKLVFPSGACVSDANVSMLIALPAYETVGLSAYSFLYSSVNSTSNLKFWRPLSNEGASLLENNLMMTAPTDLSFVNIYSSNAHSAYLSGTRNPIAWPFVVAAGVTGIMQNYYALSERGNTYSFGGQEGEPIVMPVVVSASRIRIAPSLTGDELESPSDWSVLPIFTAIGKTDGGLFFENGPAGEKGGVLALAKVDTSKGNGFGGGECLAVYENYPKLFRPSAADPAPRERLLVYGTPSNATASKTMTAYVATPPVSQDVVVGGPVVSEVYAFDSDEIRGAVNGVLGISENVEVGTMGWLDGKRYRVLLPGRMTQVG